MASDIWLRTILIVRKETRCRHIGYSFRLTAMVLLYAPSHRQDNTYQGLCYTSREALAGTRHSSSSGIPWFPPNRIHWCSSCTRRFPHSRRRTSRKLKSSHRVTVRLGRGTLTVRHPALSVRTEHCAKTITSIVTKQHTSFHSCQNKYSKVR